MKNISLCLLLLAAMAACSHKNFAQSLNATTNDTLIQRINNSKADTGVINAQIQQLQTENDFVLAFASLNYSWTRKGIFYVLARKKNEWTFYSFQAQLPPSQQQPAAVLVPLSVPADSAKKIQSLYLQSQLWHTRGDEDGRPCPTNKSCNISDGETWLITVTTPQNSHTTTYYAPAFFEECCPGNQYRKQFISIAKHMMDLGKNSPLSAPDR